MPTVFGNGILTLLLFASHLALFAAAQTCQNNGTFDWVHYTCHCPVQAYGDQCEHLFASASPCRNASAAGVTTIQDSTSAHAARQLESCSASSGGRSCINFGSLSTGWHRFESSSGNYLVSDGEFPCTLGKRIGCGCGRNDTCEAFTLRHLVLEGQPENGTNLYSARAYSYMEGKTQCYDSSVLFYNVRVLKCPNNEELYYMGPTMSSTHRYCIGVYSSTTAKAMSDPTTTTVPVSGLSTPDAKETSSPTPEHGGVSSPTPDHGGVTSPTPDHGGVTSPTPDHGGVSSPTPNHGVSSPTPNHGVSSPTPNHGVSSPTSNHGGVSSPTERDTKSSTQTSPTSTPRSSAGEPDVNYLVDSKQPNFRVNISGWEKPGELVCRVRSDSLQVNYLPRPLPMTVASDSLSAQCDLSSVLEWLRTTNKIYFNSQVDFVTKTGQKLHSVDITVCQSQFQGKSVRHLRNRSQCAIEGDDGGEFRPNSWWQWFGYK